MDLCPFDCLSASWWGIAFLSCQKTSVTLTSNNPQFLQARMQAEGNAPLLQPSRVAEGVPTPRGTGHAAGHRQKLCLEVLNSSSS